MRVLPSVALPNANVTDAAATCGHWIGPCQCDTSTPLAYVAAFAAPLPTSATTATSATTLPTCDPIRPSLDDVVFGLGKAGLQARPRLDEGEAQPPALWVGQLGGRLREQRIERGLAQRPDQPRAQRRGELQWQCEVRVPGAERDHLGGQRGLDPEVAQERRKRPA